MGVSFLAKPGQDAQELGEGTPAPFHSGWLISCQYHIKGVFLSNRARGKSAGQSTPHPNHSIPCSA